MWIRRIAAVVEGGPDRGVGGPGHPQTERVAGERRVLGLDTHQVANDVVRFVQRFGREPLDDQSSSGQLVGGGIHYRSMTELARWPLPPRHRALSTDRMRSVEILPVPRNRRLIVDALKVGRGQIPMRGLIGVDVTAARRGLDAVDPPLSMTSYVAACVGRAAARHPDVHGYRNWRGRLVLHHHVDIATIIEVSTPTGSFPMAHLIRCAESRSVADITEEVRAVQHDPGAGQSRQRLERGLPLVAATPGLVRLGYHLANRSTRLRRHVGTVSLTAIGMFGGGGGFGITAPTLATLGIVVGGITSRPCVVGDEIQIREVMDLTISIDHRIVDGAPAARFVADLRDLMESAELVTPRAGHGEANGGGGRESNPPTGDHPVHPL